MKAIALTLGVVILLWPGRSEAAPIAFTFEGTVTSVGALDPGNPFPTEPVFGTPFSGTYTFDSAAPDAVGADPATGSYAASGAPFGLSLSLGGLTLDYAAVSIGVTDGYSSFGSGDQYLVGFAAGPTLLSLRFTDFSELMFSGDALPLAPPALTGLFTELVLSDLVAGNQVDLNGTITSLTCTEGCATPVPEPATLLLLMTGVGTLGLGRRLRRGH